MQPVMTTESQTEMMTETLMKEKPMQFVMMTEKMTGTLMMKGTERLIMTGTAMEWMKMLRFKMTMKYSTGHFHISNAWNYPAEYSRPV